MCLFIVFVPIKKCLWETFNLGFCSCSFYPFRSKPKWAVTLPTQQTKMCLFQDTHTQTHTISTWDELMHSKSITISLFKDVVPLNCCFGHQFPFNSFCSIVIINKILAVIISSHKFQFNYQHSLGIWNDLAMALILLSTHNLWICNDNSEFWCKLYIYFNI